MLSENTTVAQGNLEIEGYRTPDSLPHIAIFAHQLGKAYRVYNKPLDKLKEVITKKNYAHEYWALQNVSFQVPKGQAMGVIGHNGAGKSTLLQLLAGSLFPTAGKAWIRGRVASLLELGSGFVPDFTGRENVFTNGTALGLSTRELNDRLEEIQDFAEIGDFFDQPVKTYSSGMFVRLAFAVQACVEPDVLIVDEALAVGDVFFQQKCHARMEQLMKNGTSILLVTHDSQAVRKYCSQVLLLDEGKTLFHGDVEHGLGLYFSRQNMAVRTAQARKPVHADASLHVADNALCAREGNYHPPKESWLDLSAGTFVTDSGKLKITCVALTDTHNRARHSFEQGEVVRFHVEVQALCDLQHVVIGITLHTVDNLILYCQNSLQSGINGPDNLCQGELLLFVWEVTLNVASANYTISLGGAEYPEDIASQIDGLAPETFLVLGETLFRLQHLSILTVTQPLHGLRLPFIGMAGLPTTIHCQTTRIPS